MKRALLIGSPVAHSVAPVLHHYLAQKAGIDFEYTKRQVEEADLPQVLRDLARHGYAGCNVTLPLKLAATRLVDNLDASATTTGATNTIVFSPTGARGYNTDWAGIAGSLQAAGLPPAAGPEDQAVVLGSGGAARAAIYALRRLGYRHIAVFHLEPPDPATRDLMARAGQLDIQLHSYATVESAIAAAQVVCQMTPTGMVGQAPAPFDLTRLDAIPLQGKFVLDAVFNPVATPLLSYAAARGAVTIDGLWMMIRQGLPAFELWTGRHLELSPADLHELHGRLADAVAASH